MLRRSVGDRQWVFTPSGKFPAPETTKGPVHKSRREPETAAGSEAAAGARRAGASAQAGPCLPGFAPVTDTFSPDPQGRTSLRPRLRLGTGLWLHGSHSLGAGRRGLPVEPGYFMERRRPRRRQLVNGEGDVAAPNYRSLIRFTVRVNCSGYATAGKWLSLSQAMMDLA